MARDPENGDLWQQGKTVFQVAERLPNGVSGWFLPVTKVDEDGVGTFGHIINRAGHHVMHNWRYIKNIWEEA